ncbi:hypothetical protein QWJ90_01430 [Microbacterium oryzae]|uniref:HNH endonuclease n=1 Tax=Microbacterium oryzae TaxID=743009 RepID=UPI0025B03A71|nr:hypothetical protein [Microbacterium oryzae]MDN3309584.1 hypothetical protein [Microbacterium oryzae]
MTVSVGTKRQVIARDGGFCLLALPGCLGEAQTTDHRANRGSGGSPVLDHPANLIAACTLCNGAKADARSLVLLDLEERGLWIRKAATNEETLQRAKETPAEGLDGQRWFLVSATSRVHASKVGGAVPF